MPPDINWNESAPPTTESAGLGAQQFQSLKTALRTGLDAEHTWASSGIGVGVHRLGSARAYYGPQSLVSSTGTDGRLQVTSDTSRLFHVGSAGTMFLGGSTVISAGSQPVGGQRFTWAMEMQMVPGNGSAAGTSVVFPNSGYSGIPFVVASLWSDAIGSAGAPCVALTLRALSKTGVTLIPIRQDGVLVNPSSNSYFVYSLGTRTL